MEHLSVGHLHSPIRQQRRRSRKAALGERTVSLTERAMANLAEIAKNHTSARHPAVILIRERIVKFCTSADSVFRGGLERQRQLAESDGAGRGKSQRHAVRKVGVGGKRIVCG